MLIAKLPRKCGVLFLVDFVRNLKPVGVYAPFRKWEEV
jgi:hypothetical protein